MSVNCSQKWKALGVLTLVSTSHFKNSTTLYFGRNWSFFILSADLVSKPPKRQICHSVISMWSAGQCLSRIRQETCFLYTCVALT